MAGNSDGSVVIRIKMTTDDAQKELNHLKNKIIETQRSIAVGGAKRDALTQDLERANALLDQMKAKARASGDLADWAQVEPYEKAAILAEQALERQNAKLRESKILLDGLTARYGEVSRKIGFWQKMQGSIKSTMGGIVGGISSAASGLTKMLKNSRMVSSQFKGLKMTVRRLLPALLATEGIIGILRKAVYAYMQQNQQLANTLNGAWSGLGNILGPVIDRMVNMLATAVAYFTKFLNLLGFVGKSATNQIQSAGGAAEKETEALKRQLMSFDEINRLEDSNPSASGGGANQNAAIAPEVTLPDWAKIMAEQLKSAQWAEAAMTLTNQLNQMVDSVDWAGIGRRAGHWLNGALTFLSSAVRGFDWINLGASLATGANGLLESVDWGNLGYLLWSKFKIALETAAGFLANIDFAELFSALNRFGVGFYEGIQETLDNIDWSQLGAKIIDFIRNVEVGDIVHATFETLAKAVASVFDLLKGAFWEYFGEYIDFAKEGMSEDMIGTGQHIVLGILFGILDAVKNIGTWILDNLIMPIINGILDGFGLTWGDVTDWCSSAVDAIANTFMGAWEFIRDGTARIWNGIVDGIKGAVNGVIWVINRMISAVVSGINKLFSFLSFDIPLPGGNSIGISLPQFSAPQIPYLAKGAVIPPNAPFMAMLGDQRHGTNIEAPLSTIEEAVAKVTASAEQIAILREQNRLLQAILENSGVYLDGKKLSDTVTKYQRNQMRALGV